MHLPRFLRDPGYPSHGARALAPPPSKPPPKLLLAVLCSLGLLATPACGKKHGSPAWTSTAGSPNAAAVPAAATPPNPVAKSSRKSPASAEPAASGLRFIAYNVNNWLTMDRTIERREHKGVPKPEGEKRSVIQVLSRHAPDALGICEIGTREDLAEIQSALKASGVELPHSFFAGGGDEVRHLGLLSRFPITSTASPANLNFKLNGSHFTMNRGILDATIQAHGKSYRLLGVHLKSKREVEDGDQQAMRLSEARLLRQHVDAILKTDPNARLVVYGDFNDTRGSAVLKTITGNYNEPTYLTAIPAQDKQGLRWTHFWSLHDIYSRLDFITVTQGLKPDVDFHQSCIIDDPDWIDASDHRPLLAIFN